MEFVSYEDTSTNTSPSEDGMTIVLSRLRERHRNDAPIGVMLEGIQNMTLTENGAGAFKDTCNHFVDLFYESVRGVEEERIRTLFRACWEENPYLTLRICAFIRDCRGGKGERKIGRILFHEICRADIGVAEKNAHHFFSEYGRWDDGEELDASSIHVYVNAVVAQLQKDMEFLASQTESKSVSLCAKWIPGEKSTTYGDVYKKIAKAYGAMAGITTPHCPPLGGQADHRGRHHCANFRKQVMVPLRRKIDILETKLCELRYEDIDYEKIPSVAMNIHSKKGGSAGGRRRKTKEGCFWTRDPERFQSYVTSVAKGEKKVNAGRLFPHEVVQKYFGYGGLDDLTEAQWKVMVEEMSQVGDLSECLVLADVSGSMEGTPMVVSCTMGILISSLAKSEIWKDMVLTFESCPRVVKIEGESLFQKVKSIRAIPWGGSTDFLAAMEVILDLAKQFGLPQSDIPKRLIVVSDMQFNQADGRYQTNYQVVKQKFEDAGYTLPHMVFWNVRSTSNVPVTASTPGVSMVSGFSSRVMQGVLKAGVKGTPLDNLLASVMVERYDLVTPSVINLLGEPRLTPSVINLLGEPRLTL